MKGVRGLSVKSPTSFIRPDWMFLFLTMYPEDGAGQQLNHFFQGFSFLMIRGDTTILSNMILKLMVWTTPQKVFVMKAILVCAPQLRNTFRKVLIQARPVTCGKYA